MVFQISTFLWVGDRSLCRSGEGRPEWVVERQRSCSTSGQATRRNSDSTLNFLVTLLKPSVTDEQSGRW